MKKQSGSLPQDVKSSLPPFTKRGNLVATTPLTTPKKTGVLLINLGTPAAPTPKAVRKYLAEFLSDPRVVEIPTCIWKIILHAIVLRIRPRQSAKKYQLIWTTEGSPLLAISKQQVILLQEKLGSEIQVELGMRYGEPSIASALEKLRAQKIEQLIVLPLYPQYAAATIGSSFDAVMRVLQSWRYVPAVSFINGYADFPPYIKAIADSITQHWQTKGRSEKLLFSFHGLPQRAVDLGDPYFQQCQTTARLVAAALQLKEHEWQLVFQSRFGKANWLQPYCSAVLQDLARNGIKAVDVVCPGFAADCLETLEEISLTYAEEFKRAGGEKLSYIPALNAQAEHIEIMTALIVHSNF